MYKLLLLPVLCFCLLAALLVQKLAGLKAQLHVQQVLVSSDR